MSLDLHYPMDGWKDMDNAICTEDDHCVIFDYEILKELGVYD